MRVNSNNKKFLCPGIKLSRHCTIFGQKWTTNEPKNKQTNIKIAPVEKYHAMTCLAFFPKKKGKK